MRLLEKLVVEPKILIGALPNYLNWRFPKASEIEGAVQIIHDEILFDNKKDFDNFINTLTPDEQLINRFNRFHNIGAFKK